MGSSGNPPNPPAAVNMASIIQVRLQAFDVELMQIRQRGLKIAADNKTEDLHHVNGATVVISLTVEMTQTKF